jgi:hypothetical protein
MHGKLRERDSNVLMNRRLRRAFGSFEGAELYTTGPSALEVKTQNYELRRTA